MSGTLRFTKMHGLGNDFVVIDAIRQQVQLDAAAIRRIADRHFGVGCDQLLLVEPPRLPQTHFHYRIFNQDGGEVQQCGNGARCFARFVREQGLTERDVIDVGTAAGPIRLFLEGDQVRVNMGPPVFEPARIPFQADQAEILYPLQTSRGERLIGALSMGNPHAVLQVDDLQRADIPGLGAEIERHPRFPQRVNVGFMQVLDPAHIRLRVYERGAGETLACGTGACAAAVSGQRQGLLSRQVEVELPGGHLLVQWDGPDTPVWMTGPAVSVFAGTITL
jgi:diaminopimelate epimerase